MRLHRSFTVVLRALLLASAAGALYGDTLISLGASSGSGSGCSLTNGGICTLTARVTYSPPAANISLSAVRFSFSPTVSGAVVGTAVGPDSTGLTSVTYTAPNPVITRQTVTVTVTALDGTTATQQITLAPIITVGSGAPTPVISAAFQAAFARNSFGAQVTLPPVANVRAFGSGGYVQEFTDAADSTVKDAIVVNAANQGYQILSPLYAYYSSVGANTAGYPTADSQSCSAQGVGCVWDSFDKTYALFAYATTLVSNAQNFSVNGTFYTEWTAVGGINALGSPVTAQATLTAAIIAPATTANTATVQTFANGAIYSITAGPSRGKLFSVLEPIYDLYVSQAGPNGVLGLPTSEAFQVSAGVFKQNFEGGVLQYTVGSDPTLLLPVAKINLSGAQPGSNITLNLGQSVTLTATPIITTGAAAPDRPVSWSGTNGKVISIQANGATAVVTAVGSGAASVQAASQGVTSAKITFIVIAPCCQVGDGAPASVQQAFQDALTRNKISVQSPLPSPASRVGAGYVQMIQAPDSGATYLLAQSDLLGTAYVVSGALLARYQALGGPAGALGYPASDASAGGTQLFANGALGGNPVRLVVAPLLAKWTLLGYETGAAGLPVSEATPFSTLGANTGQQQTFSKGVIYGASSGPRSGQAYFASGLILARYTDLGGPTGDFGMPISDEFGNGGVRQQNFEGGNLTYSPGDTAAVEHAAPRVPGVIVSPGSVSAGSQARLAVLGFADNSMLRVSITGSPDFVVTAVNGAYSWDMAIPLAAKSGSLAIHASDGKGATADGTLTVKGFADNRIQITKLQGDNQTGLPGSMLPLSLRVALLDSSNTPVAGAPVTFQASAGVQLSTTTAVSDSGGRAEVLVRLPASAGVAAVTATAASIAQTPVTFYVRAAASSLTNVPKPAMVGDTPMGNGTATIAQKGALLASAASILRYHQNRGELPVTNGPADAAALNQFLKQYCTVDTKGAQLCDGYLAAGAGAEQVVNLWRAAEFTGGVDVAAQTPTVAAAVDVLAQGSPALLSLSLSRDGASVGGHFVVAIGVADDGSLVIQDPNPTFARASLSDYLRGFTLGGSQWTAQLRGVVQFAVRSPSATRFLIGALSQPPALMQALAIDVESVNGPCGAPLDLIDVVDASGNSSDGLVSRLQSCNGAASAYQVSIGAPQPFHAFLTDLATAGSSVDLSGNAPATYKLTRSRLNLVVAPQDVGFTADAVVNAATFTAGIAPGGIMAIFGAGLAGPGSTTTVNVDGVPAMVLSASAFQINAVVPNETAAGLHSVQVRSAYGSAQQSVMVSNVAPAIFLIGTPPVGAVVNQDTSLNGPTSPLPRGQTMVIYATGLGAVMLQGNLSVTTNPVVVVVNGQELPVVYAGLTPGYAGLYQVNVVIPASTPPGLALSLALKQGTVVSNMAPVAIQ